MERRLGQREAGAPRRWRGDADVKQELPTEGQRAEVGTLRGHLVLYFLSDSFQHRDFLRGSKSFVEGHTDVIRLLMK